jgi:tetratricopeptide (TPR) repeat protein
VFAFLAFPTVALAQQPARDPVGAEELFRQGVALKNRGDWRTACEKFKKSFDLEPAVSTQYKIASCHEHDGRLASAWYGYQSALKMNRETRSDKRRLELDASIRSALGQLEPRVPRLRITVTPAAEGLELMRDGDSLVPASVLGEALPVDPGEHRVSVHAPGYAEQEVRVAVIEGRTLDAAITLTPVAPAPAELGTSASPSRGADADQARMPGSENAVAPQTVPRVPQQPPNGNTVIFQHTASNPHTPAPNDTRAHAHWTQVHTAYVFGAAGIVSLLAAGYFGLLTLDYVSQMNEHKRDDGKYDGRVWEPRDKAIESQNIGLVLAGAGAALGAVGVGLYATAPSRKSQEPRAWITTPEGMLTGVAVRGRW